MSNPLLKWQLFDIRISSEVSVKRFSVCNVTEKLAEYGTDTMSCSVTNDIIDILP